MAKNNKWNIVKTSGGYGVLKSSAGAKVAKSTVIRPSVSDAQHSGKLRASNTR